MVYVLSAYEDAEGFRSELFTVTDGTFDFGLEGVNPSPDGNTFGFCITALEVVDDSMPAPVDADTSHAVLIVHLELGAGAVENSIELILGKFVERCVDGESVALCKGLESSPSPACIGILRSNGAFIKTLCSIRNYLIDIILCLISESVAFGTCSEGVVEGEESGLDFTD